MTELKPCPFCGSENVSAEGRSASMRGVPFCHNCGADGPQNEVYAKGDWNTRAEPTVKPLVWEEFDAWTAWADSPVGRYSWDGEKITLSTQSSYVGDGAGNWLITTFEAAKSAAQADFDRRVKECLE